MLNDFELWKYLLILKRRQGWSDVELKKPLVAKFGKTKPEKVLSNVQTNSTAITLRSFMKPVFFEIASIWLALRVLLACGSIYSKSERYETLLNETICCVKIIIMRPKVL